MKQSKHICKVCGAEYSTCSHCDDHKKWRSVADKETCWQVYIAVTQYRLQITDASSAEEMLRVAGVNRYTVDSSPYKPTVKQQIKDIFAEADAQKKTRFSKKKAEEVTVEAEPVSESESAE